MAVWLGSGGSGRRAPVSVVLVLVVLLWRSDAASMSPDKTMGSPTLASATVEPHYKSNLELEAALQNFTRRCSHISRLYIIGNSTLGVPLWVIEISDKPGVSEPEPAFKYVGNMHGDEPLGRELVLLLADWLCDNYPKDPMATLIVDKIHLHLLPSMNPDGFAAEPNSARNNAHDIDLNRDFPDQFFPANNHEEKRQAETRAVMNWIRSTQFTASASFHEGALVANYPWDGNRDASQNYATSPDDSTFKYLAAVYSDNHPLMSKSKEFVGGITNGAAWYPLYGGMQDWNYIHGNCLELTLEMNEQKGPPPNTIPRIWSEHRKSLLELVAATVKSGVHGRVTSSRDGKPLAATIDVSGISHSIKASAGFGDYHRLLAPGQTYEVTASMPGYSSRTAHVFLPYSTAVTQDFSLVPLPTSAAGARLRGETTQDPLKEPLREETLRIILPPAPPTNKAPVTKPKVETRPTDSLEQLVEIVTWKPIILHRKGLNLEDFSLSHQYRAIYLLPLVSVMVILVCLFVASRGNSYRRQLFRPRVSKVEGTD